MAEDRRHRMIMLRSPHSPASAGASDAPAQAVVDAPNSGAQAGADKYVGPVAEAYDDKRRGSAKWQNEQTIIEAFLSDLPRTARILDIPVGTGRFVNFYQSKGFHVLGIDKSADMLAQARQKAGGHDTSISFMVGNVLSPLPQFSISPSLKFDACVMCRLTRWLTPDEINVAIKHIVDVTLDRVILTARVRNHPYARPYEMLQAAFPREWKISRDLPADGEDYRVIEFKRGF